MGIFQQFPYSNFHEMNLDQLIKIMREMQDEWNATKTEWASYKDFIDNYFTNLDVSQEVLEAIRVLANDGTLKNIIDPTIASETTEWLNQHITTTTPPVDASLSIAGAAADAKVTGDFFRVVSQMAMLPDKIRASNKFEGTQFPNPEVDGLMKYTKIEYSGVHAQGTLVTGTSHYCSQDKMGFVAGQEYTMFVVKDPSLENVWVNINRITANSGRPVATRLNGKPYHFVPENSRADCYCALYYEETVDVNGDIFIYILEGHYDMEDFLAPYANLMPVIDRLPYNNISRASAYDQIRKIPYGCTFIYDNTHIFTDIPHPGMTRGAIIHQPYQDTLDGYYIDLLISWNPNYKNKMFYRLSTPNDQYPTFDWYELTAKTSLSSSKYVAFGDSITRGYTGVVGQVASVPYPTAIASALQLSLVNEGVDGTGWFADENNTGSTGYQKIMNYDLTNTDLVTIAFGINDYLSMSNSLSQIQARVENVIDHINSDYPTTNIIFITPIFCARTGNASSDFAFNTQGSGGYTLKELCDMIETVALTHHIPCINQADICVINKNNYTALLQDSLHPNNDGYLKYGKQIAGRVSSYYM